MITDAKNSPFMRSLSGSCLPCTTGSGIQVATLCLGGPPSLPASCSWKLEALHHPNLPSPVP